MALTVVFCKTTNVFVLVNNFAQIEKELLSIVFATKKFHNFIYGRNVIILTDHNKQLVSLLNKNICDIASSRLQKMKISYITKVWTLK